MRTYHFLIIVLTAISLSSCTTLSPEQTTAPTTITKQSWATRDEALKKVQSWDLDALIAIRNDSKKTNITANMQWQQKPSGYEILLFGPLGTGSAKLSGNSHGVRLDTPDGKAFYAATPELLVAQQTNWDLPVSNLYYWIRGLPVPNMPAEKHLDENNRLVALQQQGWQIQFLRYATINQIDLPTKVFLFNPQLNVKIVINDWKI